MNSQSEHPEQLLAWYVNGTLGDHERQQVEAHLADCEHCRQEVAWLRSLRTQIQDDSPQSPGEFGLQRLLRDVRAQQTTSPNWWRPALAVAVLVIVVQSVLLLHMQNLQPAITPLGGPAASGVVVQVKFAPTATEAQIRGLLQKVDADLIGGPGALGIYRLRLEGLSLQQHKKIKLVVAKLSAHRDVITYVEQE